jgi:hypothetical protein
MLITIAILKLQNNIDLVSFDRTWQFQNYNGFNRLLLRAQERKSRLRAAERRKEENKIRFALIFGRNDRYRERRRGW